MGILLSSSSINTAQTSAQTPAKRKYVSSFGSWSEIMHGIATSGGVSAAAGLAAVALG
jgi:hypothetical protein